VHKATEAVKIVSIKRYKIAIETDIRSRMQIVPGNIIGVGESASAIINQSINQSKRNYTAQYVARESEVHADKCCL